MKDFYDLYLMARAFSFEGPVLIEAIRATFARRETNLPKDRPIALRAQFAERLRERETMGRVSEPIDPQIYQLSEFGGSVSSTEVAVALSVAKNSAPNESFLGSRYLGCDQIIQLLNSYTITPSRQGLKRISAGRLHPTVVELSGANNLKRGPDNRSP